MYPDTWREDRRWYAAMTSYWDTALGNITAAVKAKGMWENVSTRARHHLCAFVAVGTDFLLWYELILLCVRVVRHWS
jgi:hypothetical protein